MKIKKMCVMVVALGAQICAAGCNVISFFPHKAAEVAADKVIDDTLPRDPANSIAQIAERVGYASAAAFTAAFKRETGTAPGATSGAWFEFYGERIVPPSPQVGIVVWNWAELIVLYVQHILGVQPREDGVRVRPRLLAGLNTADATFTIRGKRLRLRVAKGGRGKKMSLAVRGAVATNPGEWRLAY